MHTHINVYVISSLQNVGHTVCDDIRNGNRVSEDNSWKKEKLLTVQESEIIKIIPFKKLGIWDVFVACMYSVTSYPFLLLQNIWSTHFYIAA